ncbi:uncharacterized protein LOC144337526 [Macaca mulatta]
MQPCTCNRTRSGGDAEGWPTTSLIPAHKAMSTCATDPPPLPAAPRTHSQQPHDHMHWPGQPASRVSQAWPRRAGVPAPPPPAHTQCHRPHNVTRKRRSAGPAPTPILAAPLGESRAGGAGASGRAQAQAWAGGLCSARASVGARVRPSVRWSHRTEAAAAAASASSYARVHPHLCLLPTWKNVETMAADPRMGDGGTFPLTVYSVRLTISHSGTSRDLCKGREIPAKAVPCPECPVTLRNSRSARMGRLKVPLLCGATPASHISRGLRSPVAARPVSTRSCFSTPEAPWVVLRAQI